MSGTEIDDKIIDIMANAYLNANGEDWAALKAEIPEDAEVIRACMGAALDALYDSGVVFYIPAEEGDPEADAPDAFIVAREKFQKMLVHKSKRNTAKLYEGKQS